MPSINIHVTADGHARDGDVIPLDIAFDLTLGDLKEYVSAETGLESSQLQLFLDGRPLGNNQSTLQEAGIKNGDMLAARTASQSTQRSTPQSGPAMGARPGQGRPPQMAAQIEDTRQRLLANPHALAQARQQTPDLIDAIHDPQRFAELFSRILRQGQEAEAEHQRQMQILDDDPFNVEAQQKIEEYIRQQNVEKNFEYAQEHNPEVFGSVTMLYINASVNGHNIKVFVDSGAQATIMSPECAEKCNIMRLIDKRFAGTAVGVGTAKILGRVHFADLQINNMILPCSFTVMEGKAIDMLLGLDMLKRYQVSIDLKKNKLIFPQEEVDFLPESEIPKNQEAQRAAEPTIPGPDGTEIGAESGTVRPAGSGPSAGPSPSHFSGAGHTLGGQSAPGPSQSDTAPPQSSSSKHPKDSIQHLINLGFSRQESIAALDATDGNVEYAAGFLFGG